MIRISKIDQNELMEIVVIQTVKVNTSTDVSACLKKNFKKYFFFVNKKGLNREIYR